MPLVIDLKPGEKVIINGAVLENAGSGAKLRLLNDVSILRQKEIMTENDAVTPASRVFFCLQCAYLFPNERDSHLRQFDVFLNDYLAACPSAHPLAEEIRRDLLAERHYRALKGARKLLKHEAQILEHLQQGLRNPPEA